MGWPQLGVYSEQRVMRWQGNFFPSGFPLHLLIIFFSTLKEDEGFREARGALFVPLTPPTSFALSPPMGHPRLAHFPVGAVVRHKKQGKTLAQKLQPHGVWGAHHFSLMPQGCTVQYTLKQIPHADSYRDYGVVDMKTHFAVNVPPP